MPKSAEIPLGAKKNGPLFRALNVTSLKLKSNLFELDWGKSNPYAYLRAVWIRVRSLRSPQVCPKFSKFILVFFEPNNKGDCLR